MENKMRLFAKPNDKMIIVDKNFIDNMEPSPPKEFLKQCLRFGKMLNKDINTVSTEESLKDINPINWS